jgi:hypothetical protein
MTLCAPSNDGAYGNCSNGELSSLAAVVETATACHTCGDGAKSA